MTRGGRKKFLLDKIYEARLFCKKNWLKLVIFSRNGDSKILPGLYGVATACCISLQISKLQILKRNTAGKSAWGRGTSQQNHSVVFHPIPSGNRLESVPIFCSYIFSGYSDPRMSRSREMLSGVTRKRKAHHGKEEIATKQGKGEGGGGDDLKKQILKKDTK